MATKRQKLMAAKDRERRKQERAREEEQAKLNFDKLTKLQGGFSRTPRPSAVKYKPESTNFNLERVEPFLPAKADPIPPNSEAVRLSPEMQARDDAAKEQYKIMQTRIAPAYNKGPDIYVSDGMLEDYTNGSNRRRN